MVATECNGKLWTLRTLLVGDPTGAAAHNHDELIPQIPTIPSKHRSRTQTAAEEHNIFANVSPHIYEDHQADLVAIIYQSLMRLKILILGPL